MMPMEDIKSYLPKYLSEDNYKNLLKELKSFPENIDQRLYSKPQSLDTIFQGDGYKNFPYVDLLHLDLGSKEVKGIILSNTCDLDLDNKRPYPSSIMFAPIIEIAKYTEILMNRGVNPDIIDNHLKSIRKQSVTSILFLPRNSRIPESIVFLDRIMNIDNSYICRDQLQSQRLFTLSDYGFYMLLFKLSVHFSRIQERVNRGFLR